MRRADLTPEALEDCLRALRSGKSPQDAFAPVAWLAGQGVVKSLSTFEDDMYALAWQGYASARQVEGLPACRPVDRQAVLRQVGEDFRTRNGDLAAWSALYYRYFSGADIRVTELAQAASVVQQQFRRRVRRGLALLAYRLQNAAPADPPVERPPAAPGKVNNLPLPDFTALVGAGPYLERLGQLFTSLDGPLLVSLEGIGGIGKSAMARAFIGLPETIAQWSKIIWVSARQAFLAEDGRLALIDDAATTVADLSIRLCESLGLAGMSGSALDQRLEALGAALAREKCLIVVDNLETVAEYQGLAPVLARLAGNSRFLITTRQTLREFPYVHTISVKALDAEAAFHLMESEAARRGKHGLVCAEQFDALYSLTGGHPLALKLVAAQLYLRPLSDILAGFRQARAGVDHLYRYLYWQTWRSLSDPARRMLLAFLPSDPEGEDLDFLQMMSSQPEEEFFSALRELDQFSLLEIHGDVERPRYRLHSLTVTFLQTDILHFWSETEETDDRGRRV
jgi:hypothetical protein